MDKKFQDVCRIQYKNRKFTHLWNVPYTLQKLDTNWETIVEIQIDDNLLVHMITRI
jgi:hypothetical protein